MGLPRLFAHLHSFFSMGVVVVTTPKSFSSYPHRPEGLPTFCEKVGKALLSPRSKQGEAEMQSLSTPPRPRLSVPSFRQEHTVPLPLAPLVPYAHSSSMTSLRHYISSKSKLVLSISRCILSALRYLFFNISICLASSRLKPSSAVVPSGNFILLI